jgi:hypothetical protein
MLLQASIPPPPPGPGATGSVEGPGYSGYYVHLNPCLEVSYNVSTVPLRITEKDEKGTRSSRLGVGNKGYGLVP